MLTTFDHPYLLTRTQIITKTSDVINTITNPPHQKPPNIFLSLMKTLTDILRYR